MKILIALIYGIANGAIGALTFIILSAEPFNLASLLIAEIIFIFYAAKRLFISSTPRITHNFDRLFSRWVISESSTQL